MFYKDRHDKFGEIAKLRSMIVTRDQELREYQNLYAKEKERKEELEVEVDQLKVKVAGLEEDLKREKEERQAEKEAAEQKQNIADQRIASLEEEKINIVKRHEESLDALMNEHKETIASLRDEIREADAAGYKRGIDEMVAKQQGGEVMDDDEEVAAVNPFQPKEDGPPVLTQAEIMIAAQSKTIGESGVPSTIARIDGKSGMMLIPLGFGTRSGTWKRLHSLEGQKKSCPYSCAELPPRIFSCLHSSPFRNPENLRPGDNVHVVPEVEETL